MQVLKFGGSSVADATNMSKVMDIVTATIERGRVILVCSAISGCTDRLIEIGKTTDAAAKAEKIEFLRSRHRAIASRLFTGSEREAMWTELDGLFEELAAAEPDTCESFGELFSTKIIARKLACEGIPTLWLDSRRIVRTKGGVVDTKLTYANIAAEVDGNKDINLFVAPGFIASDENGRVCTLGRGGSDYSAALYAAGSKADTLEIWTDVPGIMTTNPKVVPAARTISNISYKAALDMASFGAKVLYAPTVKPAMEAGIAINIRNTFDPKNPGTIIAGDGEKVATWKGVADMAFPEKGESQITLVGEGITKKESAVKRISAALEEAGVKSVGEVRHEGNNFFVNVRSIVVKEAVAAIHREFFEERSLSVINIFLAGYGEVGKALVDLIGRSRERIAKSNARSIRIVGVSNRRNCVVDLQGIDPADVSRRLASGKSAADGAFISEILEVAPRKAVFVDCTNDLNLFERYEELFRRGLSIVTSNRRSIAVPFVQYSAMKAAAQENGAFFRYDTTVGTALPILESIASGANCSDGITSIEAVVSCTLNHIITGYDGANTDSFATLLRRAQMAGLTERDPRIDLGGRDALRKLLILAREAGVPLEESDVEITPMLGQEYFDCTLDEFYRMLEEAEPDFIKREAELDAINKRQRFMASIRKDPSATHGFKAEIKMQLVDEKSQFYWISGTQNVIEIRSEYSAPLVIRGAGEGARQAASGVLNDILK